MKRTVSALLALLLTLTAFGGAAAFGGVISAGAEFYDYYEYTPFPGFDAFGEEDLALAWLPRASYAGRGTDFLPDNGGVGSVAVFTVDSTDAWGGASVSTVRLRNIAAENNTSGAELDSPNWAAKDKLNGKDIFGGSGVTFDGAQGFCFWAGLNGGAFAGTAKVTVYDIPAKGPFFIACDDGGTDMDGYGWGSAYETEMTAPDADGYFYFDFKTDFKQIDWWTAVDGFNAYNQGKYPIPDGVIAKLNGMQITFSGLQTGDRVYIGDWRAYRDTRVHVDELEEYCANFEALDPDGFTEESYSAAAAVYLRAYEMLLDHSGCDQKQINAMTRELKNALKALKPMFKANKNDVRLAGFEVWDDDDFDAMASGGVCMDSAAVDEENAPENKDASVMIMANAQDGEPLWGWSLFTNATADGAVKNPFEPLEGSEPLSSANGLRFWVKWGENMNAPPESMRVGLGVSAQGLYFECDADAVGLPETEGYVGVSWADFYDVDGDEDIYDCIDAIDTIYLFAEACVGVYYVADLGGFKWSTSPADLDRLNAAADEAEAYMATLLEDEWTPRSWRRVLDAIASARELTETYGATEEEVGNARMEIYDALLGLTSIGNAPPPAVVRRLEALYKCGASVWRGNVTSASYVELKLALEEAADIIDYGAAHSDTALCIERLEAAIAGLVPITAGEKVTSIFSFEEYTTRDLSKTGAYTSAFVSYELDASFARIPDGYAKALKMTALVDMSEEDETESNILQFAAMYRDQASNRIIPLKMGTPSDPKANTMMGDLTGTDGLCLWVGVNDATMIENATLRFAVSNCEVSPLFERSTGHIPLPASGSGWLYIPWEYFEYYDAWTNGNEIDLAKIYFYILRFNGEIKRGAEVYVTGIRAYKNVSAAEWETPAVNIEDGGVYDVSEQPLVPEWNAGAAILDGVFLPSGTAVGKGGGHTLEIINGDKTVTVNFTVTLPAPPVRKGDADGDGVITVADALAALRIAARLAEATPETVEVCDTDGDGSITVADALAILRVAAKLADEDSLA